VEIEHESGDRKMQRLVNHTRLAKFVGRFLSRGSSPKLDKSNIEFAESASSSEALIQHANIYYFAHMWDIKPLITVAEGKIFHMLLRLPLRRERCRDLIRLVQFIYDNSVPEDSSLCLMLQDFFFCIMDKLDDDTLAAAIQLRGVCSKIRSAFRLE
jgi:hypothetical protein